MKKYKNINLSFFISIFIYLFLLYNLVDIVYSKIHFNLLIFFYDQVNKCYQQHAKCFYILYLYYTFVNYNMISSLIYK